VNFSADAIVMDDGTEIQSWVNIAVDITASGANGLDTGTEGASRAYELYAIYNPSTQTKAGLLHRAKDYNLDEDVSAGEDGSIALRDATARTKIANGFQIDIAGPCEFVDVKLVKTGSPTGNYWFTIEGNSGGSPSGTPLATSDKYDASLLSSTATWVRIAFRTPASLSASTQYHLVMQADYAVSGSNFLSWRADTTAATYARGAKEIFDGVSTWTQDSNVDLTFKIYMTENDIAVTMPSGYTQKALICPFIYNDSGSNFLAFMQRDRSIFCFAQAPFSTSAQNKWSIFAAGSGPTAVTLYNLSALVPPRPCVVHVRWGNTTVVTTMNMGHIIGVFVNNTPGPGVPPGSYNPSSSADGHALADLGPLLIEYQGLYALGGSANSFAMINRIDW
jgi:hypothetical protein